MTVPLLESNLRSLAAMDPALAARVRSSAPDRNLRFQRSRSGRPVAVSPGPSGPRALHSLVDPEKEGRRQRETLPREGFFLFLGLGCGYQVLPFLYPPGASGLLVLEKSPAFLRAVLEAVDLRPLFADPRVRILVDPSPEELRETLPALYLPALSGGFHTLPLRPRVESEADFFRPLAGVLQESLCLLSRDFAVQSRFGKKWFVNTLTNLEAAERSIPLPPAGPLTVVTAAGPSLEEGLDRIREIRGDCFLLATDTSLPVLLKNRLTPDLVVSIDCQHVSYHHFMQGFPRELPLALDLSSPPILSRMGRKVSFFAGGHPFSRYLSRHWRRFPAVDTRGGNVTHAAVSLADRLGARRILLFGADFSCPDGKSYARGAWLYPYFRCRETRCAGLESRFFHFLFRDPETRKEGRTYTTPLMRGYRDMLEEASGRLGAELLPVPGGGLPIRVGPASRRVGEPEPWVPGPPTMPWKSFLRNYRETLAALPERSGPPQHLFSGLAPREREALTTLLPAAAAIVREGERAGSPEMRPLEQARRWTRERLGMFLSPG